MHTRLGGLGPSKFMLKYCNKVIHIYFAHFLMNGSNYTVDERIVILE